MTILQDSLTPTSKSIISLNKTKYSPLFMPSIDLENEFEKDKLIIPDTFVLWLNYDELLNNIRSAKEVFPWEKKSNKIFWRGGTSGSEGIKYNFLNITKLPRLSLVVLSKLYPKLIDARFSYYQDDSIDDKNFHFFLIFSSAKKERYSVFLGCKFCSIQ